MPTSEHRASFQASLCRVWGRASGPDSSGGWGVHNALLIWVQMQRVSDAGHLVSTQGWVTAAFWLTLGGSQGGALQHQCGLFVQVFKTGGEKAGSGWVCPGGEAAQEPRKDRRALFPVTGTGRPASSSTASAQRAACQCPSPHFSAAPAQVQDGVAAQTVSLRLGPGEASLLL